MAIWASLCVGTDDSLFLLVTSSLKSRFEEEYFSLYSAYSLGRRDKWFTPTKLIDVFL